MCRSGKRAEAVVNVLERDHDMTNILLLEGGIIAWKDEVDQTLDLD
jgi:rhodanese-related sulfurtransferase